jgi:uncharacterized membrane protein YfcA
MASGAARFRPLELAASDAFAVYRTIGRRGSAQRFQESMTPIECLIELVIGTCVGLLTGMFGVGGAFLMVPALHLFAGMPLNLAVGSVACQVLGPLTTGMLHRRAMHALYLRMAVVMLGGTLVGLLLGLQFLEWAKTPGSTWEFQGRSVPRLDATLLLCYVLLLTGLAVLMLVEWYVTRGRLPQRRRGLLEPLRIPPLVQLPEVDGRPISLPVLTTLALAGGFLSGGLGMGGAIVMAPALVFLIGVPTHRAITVTLVLFWLNGLAGAVGHALHNNVNLPVVCVLLVGGTLGAKLGSIIAQNTTGRRLRGYFGLVVLAAAALVAYRLWGLLFGPV